MPISGLLQRLVRSRTGLMISAIALLLVGCSVGSSPNTDRFYSRLAPSAGASEPLLYRSIEEMARGSSVVVRARVIDVTAGRVIEEEGGGKLHMLAVVLQPAEELRGHITETYNGKLTVSFIAGSSALSDSDLAALRKDLPAEDGIWFLSSCADSNTEYSNQLKEQGRQPTDQEVESMEACRPFHGLAAASEGLLVQGKDHVEAPFVPG